MESKVTQRRRQILVHSYLYYELNENVITDALWSKWAEELYALQAESPELAQSCPMAKEFENFDPSSGFYLNYRQPWIAKEAERLLKYREDNM